MLKNTFLSFVLLFGFAITGTSQPVQAQSAANRADPPRSQAVRNGDRAYDEGRFADAEKFYTEACSQQNNAQACQRAGRFYDYEGATRRRARVSLGLSVQYFTSACATHKDAKACAIVRDKAAELKSEIDVLKRNANLERLLIQNTIANRYEELASYEQAAGYRRKAFLNALEKEVQHRTRAVQLSSNSSSTRSRLQEAENRLKLHRALRQVPAAAENSPNTCIFYDPRNGRERAEVLNRLGRCYTRNRDAQLNALRSAARKGNISFVSGSPFTISSTDGTLDNVSCMCYLLIFEHSEDIFRIFDEQTAWRNRKGREWGLSQR